MVALRQHLPRPFNSAMEVHCANYFQMVLLRRVFSSSLAQPTFPICPNKKPATSRKRPRVGIANEQPPVLDLDIMVENGVGGGVHIWDSNSTSQSNFLVGDQLDKFPLESIGIFGCLAAR